MNPVSTSIPSLTLPINTNRRFSVDRLSGEVFNDGEVFDGMTLTIELLSSSEADAVMAAISIDAAAAWNTRASSAKADVLLAILHDDRLLEAIARGYDVEDAAQRGEPDPWSVDRVTLNTEERQIAEMWEQERIECARQGIMLAIAAMEDDE